MPLPSTGYATATITNPGSALTDFSLVVDLSRMPASWWAAVDTSDATKGRAATDSGSELAVDWIDFDSVGETGWARVKWAGTLAASGTQILRIYPPVAANASVAAGDTYGQHAAYSSSWGATWPAGAGADRTSNGNTATLTSGDVGGSPGKAGAATYYSGSNRGEVGAGSNIRPTAEITYMLWIYRLGEGSGNNPHIMRWATVGEPFLVQRGSDEFMWARIKTGGGDYNLLDTQAIPFEAWAHYAMTYDNETLTLYRNGSVANSDGTMSGNLVYDTTTDFALGRNPTNEGINGRLHQVQIHSAARSADWIAQEYAQTNNQASFWGTWSWNAPAGGAVTRTFSGAGYVAPGAGTRCLAA